MNQPTRVEEITAILRDDILTGQYRTGERLPSERDLSARFEVNRGAVRESLKKLEQLGVASINPGGARVLPIEQASLDVLGHLVDLNDRPDPKLIIHLIEVLGALLSMSARRALEDATDSQVIEMQSIVTCMIQNQSNFVNNHENWKNLGTLFANINDNLVLRLILNGLKTNFIDRLDRSKTLKFDKKQSLSIFNRIASSLEGRNTEQLAQAINDHFNLVIQTFLNNFKVSSQITGSVSS
ncbi:MAG: FadR family transcriptional regulator [Pseudomonadales bacterium]|nr:FadR family transcriptional regulator [Pseudomonadales bacterium]